MSATLGGLIKDLRLQKNLSQLEISLSLGWKESSRLSRIEQGRTKSPSRHLLDRLMDAMKLTAEEKNRLYVAGSYLPTKKDIAIAREKIAPLIDSWPYPAAALDFSWRVICANQKLIRLYQIPKPDQVWIEQHLPNVLEIIFDPNFIGNQRDKNFYIRMLAHFQYAQQAHTKERWYLDLVKRLMHNDYFRKLWPLASQYQTPDYDVYNFATKKLGKLHFYALMLPVYNDARFMVEYYFPADLPTHQDFQT